MKKKSKIYNNTTKTITRWVEYRLKNVKKKKEIKCEEWTPEMQKTLTWATCVKV